MCHNLCLHIILMVAILASSRVTKSNGQLLRNTVLASSTTSDPCSPISPCGPNSICHVTGHAVVQAQCRCLDGFVPESNSNSIIGCSPQCTRDNDCPNDQHCQAYKCVRVCQPDTCGFNAHCDAKNHHAICKCPTGYQGQLGCISKPNNPKPVIHRPIDPCWSVLFNCTRGIDPCHPNPCGQNAECRVRGEQSFCSCPIGYEGDPLTNCTRGECIEANNCPGHLTCQKNRCIDPCNIPNICGHNAECQCINHQPICSCGNRMVGDPLISCRPLEPEELCRPSPCGKNTNCKVQNYRAVCSCFDNYIGDPLKGCRPECVDDSECPSRMTCDNNKCVNPCSNACGEGALCDVVQGRARCSCPQLFYKGNPQIRCFPECTAHNDCPTYQACFQLQCVDPCDGEIGPCGVGAECKTRDHKAICSCPNGFTGHPFDSCRPIIREDLCHDNPCGHGADCTPGFDHDNNDRPVCTCPRGFFGNPLISCQRGECQQDSECPSRMACDNNKCVSPCINACGEGALCDVVQGRARCSCPQFYKGNPQIRCFPECTAHDDCPTYQACNQFQCVDPCDGEFGQCGVGAECKTQDHKAICSCPKGFTGHPFESCTPITREDLCHDNPCGHGADCTAGFDRDDNNRPVCTCPHGFFGNPLISCQRGGECQQDNDCKDSQACHEYTCQNPCSTDLGSVCGDNAECTVKNHQPVCSCLPGYDGNPIQSCYPRSKLVAGCKRCKTLT